MEGSLSEEHAKDVIVLFVLVVFVGVSGPVLGSRPFLLGPELVIMFFLFGINEDAVGMRDQFEHLFGPCVMRRGYLRRCFCRDGIGGPGFDRLS